MMFDYILGGFVTVVLLVYLVYAPRANPSGSRTVPMTINGWLQIAIFAVIIVLLVRPVGGFMYRLFDGQRNFLSPVLRPVEAGFYKLAGVDPNGEQTWISYAVGMLVFKLLCFFVVYALMRLQYYLPFNPQGQTATHAGPDAQHGDQFR